VRALKNARRCATCKKADSAYSRKRRERRLRAGLCVVCGSAKAESGITRCTACAQHEAELGVDRRTEARNDGLCIICTRRPATEDRSSCATCRKRARTAAAFDNGAKKQSRRRRIAA
jgi:hypothetical protein